MRVCSPSTQCGDEDSARVKVSRAAGELLWHAAEEDSSQQETQLRGDRTQTQRSGESLSRLAFIKHGSAQAN